MIRPILPSFISAASKSCVQHASLHSGAGPTERALIAFPGESERRLHRTARLERDIVRSPPRQAVVPGRLITRSGQVLMARKLVESQTIPGPCKTRAFKSALCIVREVERRQSQGQRAMNGRVNGTGWPPDSAF